MQPEATGTIAHSSGIESAPSNVYTARYPVTAGELAEQNETALREAVTVRFLNPDRLRQMAVALIQSWIELGKEENAEGLCICCPTFHARGTLFRRLSPRS